MKNAISQYPRYKSELNKSSLNWAKGKHRKAKYTGFVNQTSQKFSLSSKIDLITLKARIHCSINWIGSAFLKISTSVCIIVGTLSRSWCPQFWEVRHLIVGVIFKTENSILDSQI